MYLPCSSVTVSRVKPRCSLTSVTVTPGITAPLSSCTWPLI
jgi:hypothetical protein